jgi:hypothetical protein
MRKMVLLRWSAGAIGAGSVPGGAVSEARFGVLRLGEGRVTSRGYVSRGKVPVAGERGVGVGRRLVGRRRAGRRRAWRRRVERRRARRGRGVGQQPPPWHVAGDGAPCYGVRGEAVAFQRFPVRPSCASLSPQHSPSPPMPCSSHTTSQNPVPIWLLLARLHVHNLVRRSSLKAGSAREKGGRREET